MREGRERKESGKRGKSKENGERCEEMMGNEWEFEDRGIRVLPSFVTKRKRNRTFSLRRIRSWIR